VLLADLPRTPNGKVDRKALPAPDAVRPDLGHAYVAPRTVVEEALCGIWAGVLRLERVGINDNFFELGGNSLMGIELIAEVNKAFDASVPVVSLYEGSTIGSLAKLLAPETDSSSPLDAGQAPGERRRVKSERRLRS
jgi:acyl carrier protein